MKDITGIFGSPSAFYSLEDFEYSPREEVATEIAYGSLDQINRVDHSFSSLEGRVVHYQVEKIDNNFATFDSQVVHKKSYAFPKNKLEFQSLYNSLSIEEAEKFTRTLNFLFNHYEKWLEGRDSKSCLLNTIGAHGGTLAFSLHSPYIEDLLEPLAQTFKEKEHPFIDSVYYFFLRHILRISNNSSFVYSYRDQNLDLLKSISPFFVEMVEKVSQENEWLNMAKSCHFIDEQALAMHLLLKKNLIFFKNNLHALLQPRVESHAKLLENKVVPVCLLKKCTFQKSHYHKETNARNTIEIYSDNFFVEYDGNGFLFSVKNFANCKDDKELSSYPSSSGMERFFPKHRKTILSDLTRKEIAECLLDPKKAPSCEILFLFHKIQEPYHSPFLKVGYHYEDLALNTGINTDEVHHFLTRPTSPIWKTESSHVPFYSTINPNSPLVSDYLKLQKLYRTLATNEKKELTDTLSFLFDSYKSWLYKFYRRSYLSDCISSFKGVLSFPLLSKHLVPLFVTLARQFEIHKNARVEAAHLFFLKNILNLNREALDIGENQFKEIIGKVSLKYVEMLFEVSKINQDKVKIFEIEKKNKIKSTARLGFIFLLLKSLNFFKNNPIALIEPKKIFRNNKFLRHQEVPVCLIRKQPFGAKHPYVNSSTIYVNELGLPASIVSRPSDIKTAKLLSEKESQKLIGIIENSSEPGRSETVPFLLFYKVDDSFHASVPLIQQTYFEEFACNLGLSTTEVLFFLKNPKSNFWSSESIQPIKDHYFEAFNQLLNEGESEKGVIKRKEPLPLKRKAQPPVKKTQEPRLKKNKLDEPKSPDYDDVLSPVSPSFKEPMKSYLKHKQFFDSVVASLEFSLEKRALNSPQEKSAPNSPQEKSAPNSLQEKSAPNSPQEMTPFMDLQTIASRQFHSQSSAVNPPELSKSYYFQRTIESSLHQEISLETRKTSPIMGLPNIGNSCYINAALQILTHIPFFRNFINNQKYLDLASILASDVQAVLRGPGVTLELSNLNAFINNIQKQTRHRAPVNYSEFTKPENSKAINYLVKKALFEKSILETLQEFLRIYGSKTLLISSIIQSITTLRSYLFQTIFYPETNLNSMQDPVQVLEKIFYSLNLHATLIKEKFAIAGKTPLGEKEKQPATILQLSLPLDSKNQTLQELIDLNFSRTVLNDKDPLRIISETGQVYESNDWEEEYSIENPTTKYLVFQLKRYYQTNEGEFEKNSNLYSPSKVLNLARAFKSKNPKFYQLKAAILHDDFGSKKTNWGHYTSLIEIKGVWYHMNDSKVEPLPFPEKQLSGSYIFFLEALE